MPWLSILMALISFFTAKKSGASNGTAAAIAGVAGLGTYAVTHYTDWGVENLGALDGVAPQDGSDVTEAVTTVSGVKVPAPTTYGTVGSVIGTATNAIAPAMPALVAGAATAAAGSLVSDDVPWWLWAIGGLMIFKWVTT